MRKPTYLPRALVALTVIALAAHGPIAQLPHYHAFADQSQWLGLSHAADVLSNLGFAIVALWGALALARARPALEGATVGNALFIASLFLTALGSSYYHLAPDDARLVWDRLPIALACAGILAAVRAETHRAARPVGELLLLIAFAVGSVAWWRWTSLRGAGDLRPYLALQFLPLVLIPVWQWLHGTALRDRCAFAAAIALYAGAKVAELHDREVLAALGAISGHTLKHLLSAAAAGVLVVRMGASRARAVALCRPRATGQPAQAGRPGGR